MAHDWTNRRLLGSSPYPNYQSSFWPSINNQAHNTYSAVPSINFFAPAMVQSPNYPMFLPPFNTPIPSSYKNPLPFDSQGKYQNSKKKAKNENDSNEESSESVFTVELDENSKRFSVTGASNEVRIVTTEEPYFESRSSRVVNPSVPVETLKMARHLADKLPWIQIPDTFYNFPTPFVNAN